MEFIQTWQESATLAEAAQRLDTTAELASARATRYRAKGVPLKRFDVALPWESLAEFAALLLGNSDGDGND